MEAEPATEFLAYQVPLGIVEPAKGVCQGVCRSIAGHESQITAMYEERASKGHGYRVRR